MAVPTRRGYRGAQASGRTASAATRPERTAPFRPTQQRAAGQSGAPGLLLCEEAGVSPHVVFGLARLGVLADDIDQRLGAEDVVPHGGVDLIRRVGQAGRVLGLLMEGTASSAAARRLSDAELMRLLNRKPAARRRSRRRPTRGAARPS